MQAPASFFEIARALRNLAPLSPMLASVAALCVLSFVLVACAGSSGDSTDAETGASAPRVDDADPKAVSVIEDWSKALSDGDTTAAARYFATPSTAENGPGLVKIHDLARAVAFNDSLPCGAVLTEAVTEGEFTTATFKLTDRPGADCGRGAGDTAKTSFVIEDGKITDWRRVGDDQQSQPGSGQIS